MVVLMNKFYNYLRHAHESFSFQVGDASGIQSPVSFGGFGSMSRHLNRLSTGEIFSYIVILEHCHSEVFVIN